jgi:hypothetical protein
LQAPSAGIDVCAQLLLRDDLLFRFLDLTRR